VKRLKRYEMIGRMLTSHLLAHKAQDGEPDRKVRYVWAEWDQEKGAPAEMVTYGYLKCRLCRSINADYLLALVEAFGPPGISMTGRVITSQNGHSRPSPRPTEAPEPSTMPLDAEAKELPLL